MRKIKANRSCSLPLAESLEFRRLLSAAATQTVLSVPSTTELGQAFTISVAVKTDAGDPVTSGTVTILYNNSPTSLTGPVNAEGIATFLIDAGNSLYVGQYPLGAQYAGTSTDLASQTAANSTITIVSPNFTTENDGLEIASVTPGSGPGAATGQYVTAQYTGFYESDGSEFDESAAHAPGTFSFILNDNPEQVIPGFDEGMTGMEAGETRVLVIPSALGYQDGQVRVFIIHCLSIGTSTTIGAPSHLVFDAVPSAATSGGPIPPSVVVKVEDSHGNAVATDTSNVTLSIASGPNGAVLGGTTTVAAEGGFVSFSDLTLNEPGVYTLTATDTADSLPTATSTSITVTAFATFSNGTLTIIGTANDDNIFVTDNAGSVNANLGAATEGPFTNVTGITVTGGAGNDTISMAGVPIAATIGGAGGDDSITGGAGNDSLKGGAGNDTIGGAGGNDTVVGGGDDDSLKGGAGDDFIAGGPGNNTIHGGSGNDSIISGAGNNLVNGNDGNDTIVAGAGSSQLFAGPGNDSIIGSTTAGDLADSIYCGTSPDTILAGTNDSIFDTIPGDQITGGIIVH